MREQQGLTCPGGKILNQTGDCLQLNEPTEGQEDLPGETFKKGEVQQVVALKTRKSCMTIKRAKNTQA